MVRGIIQIGKRINAFGFNGRVFVNSIRGLGFYIHDYFELKKQKKMDEKFKLGPKFPILNERFEKSGNMSGHYFHQDLFVARKIFENNPSRHIDIGSRADGFVAHVAVFREIELIDIRKQTSTIKNIIFRQADLMKLPIDLIDSCDSISSLHAIEHFGLGRYGDPIDYYGYLKALENITKIVRKSGKFYFSVPIGESRIEFNAHRVFSIAYLLELLLDNYLIESFSYVNDNGDFFEDVALNQTEIETNFGCHFGCGIFELKKL